MPFQSRGCSKFSRWIERRERNSRPFKAEAFRGSQVRLSGASEVVLFQDRGVRSSHVGLSGASEIRSLSKQTLFEVLRFG
jgi:hypothetical protein